MHYETRANDTERVKEELKEGVEEEDYSRSIFECIMSDRLEILDILLSDKNIKEDFIYALEMGSKDVIHTFIDAGVGIEDNYGDFLADFLAVTDL